MMREPRYHGDDQRIKAAPAEPRDNENIGFASAGYMTVASKRSCFLPLVIGTN